MRTLLLSFDNDTAREAFIQTIKEKAGTEKHVQKALSSLKLDPPIMTDDQRFCAVYVSGRKIVEGNLKDMNLRFEQEVGSHSATVELREQRAGEWITTRSRRFQR